MIPKNNKLLKNARQLRKNMTRHERRLWYDFLQTYPVKMYKQRIIGNYIADFYCHAAKLVIELDGSQHYTDEGKENDTARDERLNELGIEVLRFSNLDIDRRFKDVCMTIHEKVKQRGDTP